MPSCLHNISRWWCHAIHLTCMVHTRILYIYMCVYWFQHTVGIALEWHWNVGDHIGMRFHAFATRVVSGASFLTGVCSSVTLLIVDLWQYYVCCTNSGAIRCTLFMVLFLCRKCRFGLHAALWSHIGTPMRHLAGSPAFFSFSAELWLAPLQLARATSAATVQNW